MLRKKVNNLKTELHRKAVRLLCANYEVILLPHFNTADMAAHEHPDTGKRRVLANKTVRKMLCWGHYAFKQLLHAKAREAQGEVTVLDVDEAYTSKTCGLCGRLNDKLGSSKLFKCPHCHGPETDRDHHAARNVLIKNWDVVEGLLRTP